MFGGASTGVPGCLCWCHWVVLGRHKGAKPRELLCGDRSHPLPAPCRAEGGDGGTRGFLRTHMVPSSEQVAFG